MSFLLDQADCKALHGKLGLLGSNTHPLVSEKVAVDAASPPLFPQTVQLNPQWGEHRNKLLKILGLLGLGGVAVGGGVTGGIGLLKLHQMRKERPPALPGNVPVHMPISRFPEEEKTAADTPTEVSPLHWRAMLGQAAQHPMQIPWSWPALLAVGGGSVLGTSALANKYLHGKMKEHRQQQLDQSQQEFDQAMLERYQPSEKVSAALDHLYNKIEKKAMDLPPQEPVSSAALEPLLSGGQAGWALGAPSVVPIGAGLLGLRAGYQWGEKRKPETLLHDALQQRALMRSQAMPSPVFIDPVGVRRQPKEKTESEKKKEPAE